MQPDIDKREILCSLAEIYLDTRENSYISINDGIMDSHDFDSISFLMLLSLTFSKQEMLSLYSIDIEVSDDIRHDFIEKEYSKIMMMKKDKPTLGKIILEDAKENYESQYGEYDSTKIDENNGKFFL